jgi:hypothetical protein
LALYTSSISTNSPASRAGSVSEPRLTSETSARNRVRVGQCVSAVRAMEVLVFVCLRSSCDHVTEVFKGLRFMRLALKVATEKEAEFVLYDIPLYVFVTRSRSVEICIRLISSIFRTQHAHKVTVLTGSCSCMKTPGTLTPLI